MYTIKDAIARIDSYSQRHLGAKPMSQQDKQIISGHILPLIVRKAPLTEKNVERTEKVDQETGDSEIVPQSNLDC